MRPLLKALQFSMWVVAGRADLIVVATPGIADRVRQKTGTRTKILLIGNSVTKEFRDASEMCRERVPKLRPVVAYVGLIGDAQGLEIVADVAQLLPDVDFIIVGEGPERGLLEEKVTQMHLTNVQLTGYLARSDVLEMYTAKRHSLCPTEGYADAERDGAPIEAARVHGDREADRVRGEGPRGRDR